MRTEIHDPYKVNNYLYKNLIVFSFAGMVIGGGLSILGYGFLPDILRNVSFGCFSSSVVTLIIEINNVKEKNQKANSI